MTSRLRRPAAALAVALGAFLVALILDRGSPANRDAALIVGSLAMYALIPAALIWLGVAFARHLRSRRGGAGR